MDLEPTIEPISFSIEDISQMEKDLAEQQPHIFQIMEEFDNMVGNEERFSQNWQQPQVQQDAWQTQQQQEGWQPAQQIFDAPQHEQPWQQSQPQQGAWKYQPQQQQNVHLHFQINNREIIFPEETSQEQLAYIQAFFKTLAISYEEAQIMVTTSLLDTISYRRTVKKLPNPVKEMTRTLRDNMINCLNTRRRRIRKKDFKKKVKI